MAHHLDPQFLTTERGRVFALHVSSGGETRGSTCIVVAQAFEEELNRCRYMLNLLGQALAAQGNGLLLLDPYGSGDSEGSFEEVQWDQVKADVALAARHARGLGYERVILLGVRLGALTALEVAPTIEGLAGILLWQPVLNGQQAITQLFRIKIAASLGRNEKALTVKDYEALSAAGETIEVSGYMLSPTLVDGIRAASLDTAMVSIEHPLGWITAIASAERKAPRAEAAAIEKWRDAGKVLDYQVVVGPPYWQTPERTLAPAVVSASADWVARR